jgi:hypothetical protein
MKEIGTLFFPLPFGCGSVISVKQGRNFLFFEQGFF